MGKSYFEVLEWASSFLEEQGKEGYSILFLLLERKGWSKTDWLIHMKEEMPSAEQKQLKQDIERLIENYPAQYILGYADFYEHRFFVTEATLIPRPETEELVDLCLKENPAGKLTVADVGTGTGAIAISLKLARPAWQLTAIDISNAALNVAKENAEHLGADVYFILGNGLQPIIDEKIDLLISNPPYISKAEWSVMDESVRTYEPKTALFAANDGLAMYQQLAEEAKKCLATNGKIYLEIGYQQGKAVQEIFAEQFPKSTIRIIKDLSGNDRIIAVTHECEKK